MNTTQNTVHATRLLPTGAICEISKAYEMETGARTGMDEVACAEAEVLRDSGKDDVLVWVKAKGEYWVNRSRLVRRR
jgi:hypothetical protein